VNRSPLVCRCVLFAALAGVPLWFAGCGPSPAPLPDKATIPLGRLRPPVRAEPSEVPPLDPLAEQVLTQAEELIDKGQHAAAAGLLTQALGENFDHPRFLLDLGRAWAGMGRRQARETLERAAELEADNPRIHLALAKLQIAAQKYPEAVIRLRKALACPEATDADPCTGETLLLLGQLLHKQGYWTAALECWNRLADNLDAHPRAQARSELLRPLVVRPYRLQTNRAQALVELRRYDEAVGLLRQTFRRDRSDPRTARLLLEALCQRQQYDEARQLLRDLTDEATQREQLPAMMATLTEKLLQRNRPGEAIEALAAVVGEKYETAELIQPALGKLAAGVGSSWIETYAARLDETDSPIDFALHYVTGRLARRKELIDLAAEQMHQAIRARPDFLPAYEEAVNLHLERGDDDALESLQEQVRTRWPDSHFTHYIVGKIALADGRVDEAVDQLERARRLNESHAATAVQLALAYARSGRLSEAVKYLYDALTKNPDDEAIYGKLFALWVSRGDYQAARGVAQQLLARDSDNVSGKTMLAEALLGLGQSEKAKEQIEHLRTLAPHDPKVLMLELTAKLDLPAGLPHKQTFEQAMRRLDEIAAMDGTDQRAREMKAQLLLRVGRADEAAEVLEQVYRRSGDSRKAKAYVAALMEAQKYEKVLEVVQELLAAGNQESWVRRTAVAVLEELGRYEQATQQARENLANVPAESKELYRLKLVQLHRKTKQFDEALELLEELLLATPAQSARHMALRSTQVDVLVEAGRIDEALQTVRSWIAEDDESLEPRRVLVVALNETGRSDQADKWIDEWVDEVEPEQADVLRAMKLRLYRDAGQFDQAIAYAREWIARRPGAMLPRMSIITELLRGKQYEQADELLEGWLRSAASQPTPQTQATTASTQPTQPATAPAAEQIRQWCREMIVRLKLLAGNNREGLRLAEEFLSDDPEDVELLILQANALSELGRDEQALAVMEDAYKANTDDPLVNNNLGYMYAQQGVRLDRAERMIRFALRKEADQLSFLDSLGWVYYKTGRHREAGALFMGIVRNTEPDQGDPVIYDHAGDTYYRLGWTGKAVEMWRAAKQGAEAAPPSRREIRELQQTAAEKIIAAEAGKPAPVAPLGEVQYRRGASP